MILFFVHHWDESEAFLEEDEFQHCIKVLRHTTGDTIHITDGKGLFAKARIEDIYKKHARITLLEKEQLSAKANTTLLAVAPPKSKSRWELILEKSVEAGVDIIVPFSSSHSERVKINTERAEKIMRSAALQSKRIRHPRLNPLIPFDEVLALAKSYNADGLLAHYKPSHEHIITVHLTYNTQLILIGPEGDFSDKEYGQALAAGFTAVNISRHRLRTETAAILSVCLLEARHHSAS